MKQTIVFLLFSLLFVQHSYSQNYFGKKWGLRVGMKTNFGLQKNKDMGFFDFNSDQGLLIPKIVVGFQKESRRNNVFIFEGFYQDLPNSKLNSFQVVEGYFKRTTIYDSILTKSHSFQLAVCFRKFLEIGSIGKYLELRMANNFIFNKSLQYNSVQIEYADLNFYTYELHKKVVSGMSQVPQLSLGYGNVYPLNKKLTLDAGFNFGISFARRRFDESETTDPEKYHRAISSQKIFSSNMLEFNLVLTLL